VGSPPIAQKKLTAERLASALREVTSDQVMRQRAEALGKKIRREDGVGKAVAFIEQRFAMQ
jgi:sterol 3beta-glucosyltransferase